MPSDLSFDTASSRLTTTWLGCTLSIETEVDSTNTHVVRLARQGKPHGTVMIADAQTKGRGRLDRSWHSPAGTNLYFSALLRLDWKQGRMPPLSLAAGIAVAEALRLFLPQAPELKWPNDVLYENRKLAGILTETGVDPKGRRYAVIGIGLNVNQTEFPPELAELATSLFLATGKKFDRAEVFACVLGRLEHWLDRLEHEGEEPIVATWQQRSSWIGRQIKIQSGGSELAGTVLGLDRYGALRIRDVQGDEHVVLAGDVSTI